jgi:hypothetical protein
MLSELFTKGASPFKSIKDNGEVSFSLRIVQVFIIWYIDEVMMTLFPMTTVRGSLKWL